MTNTLLLGVALLGGQVLLAPGQNLSAFLSFALILNFARRGTPLTLLLAVVTFGTAQFLLSSWYHDALPVAPFLKNLISFEKTFSLFFITIIFSLVLPKTVANLGVLLTSLALVGFAEQVAVALLMHFKLSASYLSFVYPGTALETLQEQLSQLAAEDKKEQAKDLVKAVLQQVGALNVISNLLYFLVLLKLFGKRVLGYQSTLAMLRLSKGGLLLFFCSWLFFLIGKTLEHHLVAQFALSLLLILAFLYFLQGCGILLFHYQLKKIQRGHPPWGKWLLVLILFLGLLALGVPLGLPLSVGVITVFTIGFLDQWLNYRRLS